MAKRNKVQTLGLVVFFIVLLVGVVLRLTSRASVLTPDQRFNCTAGSIAVFALLDIMFFVYAYLASKVNLTEQNKECNSYFLNTMLSFWVLEFMWVLFDILGKAAMRKSEMLLTITWGVLEFVSFIGWTALYVYNINRASRADQDVLPA